MKRKGNILVWLARQLATLFGLGFMPKAPGTWGTLAAVPLVYLIQLSGPLESLVLTLFLVVLGVVCSDIYCRSNDLSDPNEVIIDEVGGYAIAMIWLPFTPFYILGTFVVFRILDIFKPPPVSLFDFKDRGGLGVMPDDIVAGILTSLLFQWILQSGVLKSWI